MRSKYSPGRWWGRGQNESLIRVPERIPRDQLQSNVNVSISIWCHVTLLYSGDIVEQQKQDKEEEKMEVDSPDLMMKSSIFRPIIQQWLNNVEQLEYLIPPPPLWWDTTDKIPFNIHCWLGILFSTLQLCTD